MPEGPSIVILREEAARFARRRVMRVSGNSTQDIERMRGRTVREVRSWGKHFLLGFDGFSLRIHFMLFGSYRINEGKATPPRLALGFSRGEVLNFYACSVRFIEGALGFDFYRWKKAGVLKKHWQVHAKSTCPRDGARLSYRRQLGQAGRRAFWCDACQRPYVDAPAPRAPGRRYPAVATPPRKMKYTAPRMHSPAHR